MTRSMILKVFLMTLFVMLQTGCVRSTIVNLTPSQLSRNAQGTYRFEAAWDSNQRSIADESIKAYVVLDEVHYPMERIPVVKDRWEVMIPVNQKPKGHAYHMKFDFSYHSFPEMKPSSLRTEPFTLKIVEPNAP